MNENQDKQVENKPLRDEKGRLLPGSTANPNGRPKGQTLKEYMAERFRTMSPEEKEEWLKDVAKSEKWRMAEGNPKQDVEADVKGELKVIIPKAVADTFNINDNSNQETRGSNTE